MYEQVEKSKENTASADRRKSRSVTNFVTQKRSVGEQGLRFEDNRPEAVAQRSLSIIANNNLQVMQHKRYCKGEVEPPSSKNVRYSEVTIQGTKATKRMQANKLSHKTKAGGSKTTSGNHSALFLALRQYFNQGDLHDMHMLHEKLGGEGKPPNLVPGTKETNNNMMDFEQAVIAKIDNSRGNFAVVDYEVTANYGRTGNDIRAALPTSIDMRVTEKEYDKKGTKWVDDKIIHTRNVAVNTPQNFGTPNASAKPSNEASLDISNPITINQNHNRIANSRFGDSNWARNEISRVDNSHSVLFHWRNYNLISKNVEDSHFKFSKQQLEEGLKLTFKDDLDNLLLQLGQAKILGKNEVRQSINQHWKDLISKGAAKSIGKFGYPKDAIYFYKEEIKKEHTELSQYLENMKSEYAMKSAETSLKLARFAAWNLAKEGQNTKTLKEIADNLVSEIEKGISSLAVEVQRRLELPFSFFKSCTMSREDIQQNYVVIPEYIDQMKIVLGVD